MSKFYITFGQQYRKRETHPIDCRAHPDGWFEIEADNYNAAHDKAFEMLDKYWSFLYTEKEFQRKYYPLGKLN